MNNFSSKASKVLGVISDTHGMVRPEAVEALHGVGMILHAGDVGKPEVLDTLNSIAPVVAVRGNNDKGSWADVLPQWDVVEVGAVYIYVLHDLKEIEISPVGNFQVVISGHSHVPSIEQNKGVLYLNPGSAGPRRFSLPVSVARLTVIGAEITPEIVRLSV